MGLRFCMVFPSWLAYASFELFQRSDLVCTQKCCNRESCKLVDFIHTCALTIPVWCCVWTRPFPHDFRLGANSIHWISTTYSVVGCCKCSRGPRNCHVDHRTLTM